MHHVFCLAVSYPEGVADTVSWDHFFQSLQHYFTSMRHEVSVGADVVLYGHPVRAITPLELDGICHLLQLTTTVANQVRPMLMWDVFMPMCGTLCAGLLLCSEREHENCTVLRWMILLRTVITAALLNCFCCRNIELFLLWHY